MGPQARRDQVLDVNNLHNPIAWAPPHSSTLRADRACYTPAGRSTVEDVASSTVERDPGVLSTRWGYLGGPVGCLTQPLDRLRRCAPSIPRSLAGGAPIGVSLLAHNDHGASARRGTWPGCRTRGASPTPPPPTVVLLVVTHNWHETTVHSGFPDSSTYGKFWDLSTWGGDNILRPPRTAP